MGFLERDSGKSYPQILTRGDGEQWRDQSVGSVKKAQLETRHLELYQGSFICNVQSTGFCVSKEWMISRGIPRCLG